MVNKLGFAFLPFILALPAFAAVTAKPVPWDPANLASPHTVISAKSATLIATVDPGGNVNPLTFSWHFGDGSADTAPAPVTNQYNLSTTHTYTAADGTPFTAVLTVTDTVTMTTSTGNYPVIVRDSSCTASATAVCLQARVNIAIDKGLWFLHLGMWRENTVNAGGATIPWGGWDTVDAHPCISGTLCQPSSAVDANNVQAFEVSGHLESGPTVDPYTDDVARALARVERFMIPHPTNANGVKTIPYNPAIRASRCSNGSMPNYSTTPATCASGTLIQYNPGATSCTTPPCTVSFDSNGDGQILLNGGDPQSPGYEGGMLLTAIVASANPAGIAKYGTAATGGLPGVLGQTYANLAADLADGISYCQYFGDDLNTNGGDDGGAWEYNCAATSNPNYDDNSVSQWNAIGLIAASRGFGIPIPAITKDTNQVWTIWDQDVTPGPTQGQYGYNAWNDPLWGPYAVTPSGAVQLAMDGVGRTAAGNPDQRWNMYETFYRNNFCNTGGAGVAPKAYTYGLFSFTKSMENHDPGGTLLPITTLAVQPSGANPLDWYNAQAAAGDACDGVAQTLASRQGAAGQWSGFDTPFTSAQSPMDTAWSIIMLQKTSFTACVTNLAAVAQGGAQPSISLSWAGIGGAASYAILRSTTTGGPYTPVGNTTITSFVDNTPALLAGGTFYYVVQPNNAGGGAICQSNEASAVIAGGGGPSFSIATACPLPNAQINNGYSQTLAVSGGKGPFMWSSTPLPPGLMLNPASGVISGSATAPGGFPFTLTVKDSSTPAPLSASENCSLQVDVGIPVITTGCPLPTGTAGVAYLANLAAVGGLGPPAFSISGALPPGLFFANNAIQGDPSTPGVYNNFSLVLGSQSQKCSITINANPIAFNGCPLVAGAVGVDYSQTLMASGGTAPYAFFSSGLPGGLTITTTDPGSATTPGKAIVSGKPTGAGNANVILSVTDKTGLSNGQFCTLSTLFAGGDILLSNGTSSFSGTAGGAAPPLQNLSIISGTGSPMPFLISGTIPKWLLFNTLSGITPGVINISVDPTGQTASSTPLTANLTVSAGPSGPPHPLTVNFTVQNTPPQLGLSAPLISLATPSSSPVLTTQGLLISNIGGGNLTFNASVLGNTPWLTILSANGAIGPGGSNTIQINADPSKLQPGYNRGVVNIKSNSGPDVQVPVTFLISTATLTLDPMGSQFRARQGNPVSNPNRSFTVQTSSTATVNWTAQNFDAAPWLTVTTPNGTSTSAFPGTVSYTVNANGLPVGTSYARIRVSSAAGINSPQDFIVVLSVLPNSTPPVADPQPAGLIFVSRAGSPTTQSVINYTSSGTPLAEQVSVTTDGGLMWLSASAVNGTTSSIVPDQINVTANGAGLPGGVYRGTANLALGGLDVRSINTTLIVPAVSIANSGEAASGGPSASCAASKAIPTQTGLASNFSSAVAWPTPIAVQLVTDCGDFVGNGQVVVTFSNGDPPLALSLNNGATGLYSGTWVPQNTSAQVAVTARGSAPGLQATTHQISGAVTANAVPILFGNSTLNNFNPQVGNPLAPGTVVQIYGQNLAPGISTQGQPLPMNVNGTQVLIGGEQAALYYVSPTQIDAQLPVDLTPEHQYQVLVSANGALTLPQPIYVRAATPGLLTLPDGSVYAQHAADGSQITAASPAKPNEFITLYMVGLGDTDPVVPTGQTTPNPPPFSNTKVPVTVTIDGNPAPVQFAGLTPGGVGLYQVNLQVPANAVTGNLTVLVMQGAITANSATLPVQQ